MIGVDTNVLLRLLVNDSDVQSAAAQRFFKERTARDPAFVGSVVLAELVWLLRRRFGYSDAQVLRALRAMTSTDEFRFEHDGPLRSLVEKVDCKASDVADALIAWACEGAKCEKVVTFDKRSARTIPRMELLS